MRDGRLLPVMATLSGELTCLIVVTLPIFFIYQLQIGAKVAQMQDAVQKADSALTNGIEENLVFARTKRLLGLESFMNNQLLQHEEKFIKAFDTFDVMNAKNDRRLRLFGFVLETGVILLGVVLMNVERSAFPNLTLLQGEFPPKICISEYVSDSVFGSNTSATGTSATLAQYQYVLKLSTLFSFIGSIGNVQKLAITVVAAIRAIQKGRGAITRVLLYLDQDPDPWPLYALGLRGLANEHLAAEGEQPTAAEGAQPAGAKGEHGQAAAKLDQFAKDGTGQQQRCARVAGATTECGGLEPSAENEAGAPHSAPPALDPNRAVDQASVESSYAPNVLARLLNRIDDEASDYTQVGALSEIVKVEDPTQCRFEEDGRRIGFDEAGDITALSVSLESFSYGKREVLHHISFAIPQGARVGVMGTSGTGKSTLMSVLTRVYPLHLAQGRIEVLGSPINEVVVHEAITMMEQSPVIFSGTVRQNLVIDAEDADESHIRAACEKAKFWDDIKHLSGQLDSEVGYRGKLLSGGQRQRLCLARALLRNTPILILDEPISSLDPPTVDAISETLGKLTFASKWGQRPVTTLAVSHNLVLFTTFTHIVYVHKGTVVECGVKEQLLRRKGHYCREVTRNSGIKIDPRGRASITAQRLRVVWLFSNSPVLSLQDLAKRFESTQLNKGDVVTRKGEDADTMYILASGSLRADEYTDGDESMVWSPGQELGVIALVDDVQAWPTTVRVVSPNAILLELRQTDLEALIATDEGLADSVGMTVRCASPSRTPCVHYPCLRAGSPRVGVARGSPPLRCSRVASSCLHSAFC